jgi:predicted lactoylglutathione lyase
MRAATFPAVSVFRCYKCNCVARAGSRCRASDPVTILHHLAWVADSRADVDRLHKLLVEIGATVLDPPTDYPHYREGYYAVFFADPDGLKLEFVHTPEPPTH